MIIIKTLVESSLKKCEESYTQLFEYVFVIGLKEDACKKLWTQIMYRFPPVVSTDFAVKDSVQFDQSTNSVSHVLTAVCICKRVKYKSESDSYVDQYCWRATIWLLPETFAREGNRARFPEVFCMICHFGCFDLYKVLDHVEQRRAVSKVAAHFAY